MENDVHRFTFASVVVFYFRALRVFSLRLSPWGVPVAPRKGAPPVGGTSSKFFFEKNNLKVTH